MPYLLSQLTFTEKPASGAGARLGWDAGSDAIVRLGYGTERVRSRG